MSKNGHANMQISLNKGAGGASFTIFVTDCSIFLKNTNKVMKISEKRITIPCNDNFMAFLNEL